MSGAEVDFVVVGSGAAGLTAALTAHEAGLSTALLEADRLIGGSTAWSEGMIWVPCSAEARAAGIEDSPERALAYLRATARPGADPALLRAYLEAAPGTLDALHRHSPLRFALNRASGDYYPGAEGATRGARAFNPLPFDGRALPRDLFARIRPPLPVMTLFWGMSVASQDLTDYHRVLRSAGATARVAGHVLAAARDRLAGWPRGTRIANGNAIVGALVAALHRRGVVPATEAAVTGLETAEGRVAGVRLADGRRIGARRGVLLAIGGFGPETAAALGGALADPRHVPVPPRSGAPDAAGLAQGVGGVLRGGSDAALWTPVSLVPLPGGRMVPWPHFGDRAKPGVIAVDAGGRRFANEGCSYHDFVPAMRRASEGAETRAWLIADATALRRHGLGAVGPWPMPPGRWVRSGYLRRAGSISALARVLGLPPGTLSETVARVNAHAARGEDPDFGKGHDPYSRGNGDARVAPNPCLAPLARAPFYAIEMRPGDIGGLSGLAIDASARVLDGQGRPVPGLYAAGNAAASICAGAYPGPGLTIGPAMIFGRIAALHAAGETMPSARHREMTG